jgi:hypothetical protein
MTQRGRWRDDDEEGGWDGERWEDEGWQGEDPVGGAPWRGKGSGKGWGKGWAGYGGGWQPQLNDDERAELEWYRHRRREEQARRLREERRQEEEERRRQEEAWRQQAEARRQQAEEQRLREERIQEEARRASDALRRLAELARNFERQQALRQQHEQSASVMEREMQDTREAMGMPRKDWAWNLRHTPPDSERGDEDSPLSCCCGGVGVRLQHISSCPSSQWFLVA